MSNSTSEPANSNPWGTEETNELNYLADKTGVE